MPLKSACYAKWFLLINIDYFYTSTFFLSFVQQSEPSIFTKYQAKPQLFDEDTREKGLLNFGAAQGKRVLENFKANNNKIKDKYDRYVHTANFL